MKRILCATDLSSRCEGAVHRAGMLAQRLGARLALLHVIDPTLPPRVLAQEQRRAVAQLRALTTPPLWSFEAAPMLEVRTGHVAMAIREVAEESGAELIVMGAQRRRAVRDTVVGATIERVLRTCGCATLLVNRDPVHAYRNVVLALDSSAVYARAVQIAEAFVLSGGTRTSVIHAFQPPYEGMLAHVGVSEGAIVKYSMQWRREAHKRIVTMLEGVSAAADRYDVVIRSASPVGAITEMVERTNPDLLIVGTRGQSRLRRMFAGSVADRVLREIECDILAVPPADRRYAHSSAKHEAPPPARRECALSLEYQHQVGEKQL